MIDATLIARRMEKLLQWCQRHRWGVLGGMLFVLLARHWLSSGTLEADRVLTEGKPIPAAVVSDVASTEPAEARGSKPKLSEQMARENYVRAKLEFYRLRRRSFDNGEKILAAINEARREVQHEGLEMDEALQDQAMESAVQAFLETDYQPQTNDLCRTLIFR